MNLHFAYPNWSQGQFIGCGRYRVFSAGQEPPGYAIADPFAPTVHDALEASVMLAPEPIPPGVYVYETGDPAYHAHHSSYCGDSLLLAFLAALINRTRFVRPHLAQSDLWMTGKVTLRGSGQPVLEPVAQAGFDGKLSAFLNSENRDQIFMVPFANIADQLTTHEHLSQRPDVEVVSLEWLLQQTPAAKKTIISVRSHELPLLVERLFQKPEPLMLWQGEPGLAEQWVERRPLMEALKRDWLDPACHLSALTGLGGAGKSALARQWAHELLTHSGARLGGICWWNFAARPNVEAFFEAVHFNFCAAPRQERGAQAAIVNQVIDLACQGTYLFILDSLEHVLTLSESGRGRSAHPDLRRFLGLFTEIDAPSFCLLTSRCELEGFSCRMHQVGRFNQDEGRELLRKLGTSGDDAALNAIVERWQGHALSLMLFAARALEFVETADSRTPVQDILAYYDAVLSAEQRAFLQCMSLLRRPVDLRMLERLFRGRPFRRLALTKAFADLPDRDFDDLIKHLRRYRLIDKSTQQQAYSTHPLIAAHYREQLQTTAKASQRRLHCRIADYYERNSSKPQTFPRLEDLELLIEAIHHVCCAGEYDEAYTLLWHRLNQYPRFVLPDILGAWETYLTCMSEFFIDGEPQVSDLKHKASLLHEVGFCLMTLGRLREVRVYYQRSIELDHEIENWLGVSRGCQNLVELSVFLGELDQAAEAAAQALDFAHRAIKRNQEQAPQQAIIALVDQAMIAALRGEAEQAGGLFSQAENAQRRLQPDAPFLRMLEGVKHADFLRRTRYAARARQIAEANLAFCEQEELRDYACQCHRILGDLDAEEGQPERAGRHYDAALRLVRELQRRDVLIEVLLARGVWQIRCGDRQAAFETLNEALRCAVADGFRLYEADIRRALSHALLSAASSAELTPSVRQEHEAQAAREYALALQICEETGYACL